MHPILSWLDFFQIPPADPQDMIAIVSLDGKIGEYRNSSNYINPGTWVDTPAQFHNIPVCLTLHTDNEQMVADAAAWNLSHLTGNLGNDVAPPLRKTIFLRGGIEWSMEVQLDLSPDTQVDLQLSYLVNAATRGDCSDTVPVIAWNDPFSGAVNMLVTLKAPGPMKVEMGMRMQDQTSGDYSMFDMDWIIVP